MAKEPTPLGAATRGLAAGFVGTAAMDVTQMVIYKLRGKESGNWESWEEAPGPAKIGKRVIEGVLRRGPVSEEQISTLNNAVHWTYGPAWGVLYGLVQATFRPPWPLHGALFGVGAVWGASLLLLPGAKLAKPVWEYGPKTNAFDITYHLAYGLGVAAGYRAIEEVA